MPKGVHVSIPTRMGVVLFQFQGLESRHHILVQTHGYRSVINFLNVINLDCQTPVDCGAPTMCQAFENAGTSSGSSRQP